MVILNILRSQALRKFDSRLNQAHLKGVLTPQLQELFTFFYSDPWLMRKAADLIEAWTMSYSADPSQIEMREAWEAFINRGLLDTPLQEELANIYATRRERWERLSQQTGIPVPDAFRLYRGVDDDEKLTLIRNVVRAWRFEIPVAAAAKSLAAWSMKLGAAERFASNPAASLIYEAVVPFNKTILDKWVDDHNFVQGFAREAEVVTATELDDAILVEPSRVQVNFESTRYSFKEKDGLMSAWEGRFGPIK